MKIKQSPTDKTCFMYWDVATDQPNCFWVTERRGWQWNNDYEKPTVTPSILNENPQGLRNHVFIKNGRIQYLTDCSHEMAGKTVDMVDFPEDW